jgi:hypothetical protein
MHYVNDYDLDTSTRMHAGNRVVEPAIAQVRALMDYANCNSDGWAYWRKPCQAAQRLITLIETADRAWRNCGMTSYPVEAELRKALVPVKAFRTRELAAGRPGFEIVEV